MKTTSKQEDLMQLANAVIDNLQYHDRCEFGSIGTDSKRPFGNSSVESDMLKIIGWEMEGDDGDDLCYASYQREYVGNLFTEELASFIRDTWNSTVLE